MSRNKPMMEFIKGIPPATWQKILGTIGVITAILLAQTDVPLPASMKLGLVVISGVVGYLRPGGGDA